MASLLTGLLASFLSDFSKTALGFKVVLFFACVYLEAKLRFALKLRRACDDLLKDSNHAVQHLLNALAPNAPARIQTDFKKWDSDTAAKLEDLQRKRICTAWHVDHFKELVIFTPVASPLGDMNVSGMIAEKALRLKNITRDLDHRAAAVWPFPTGFDLWPRQWSEWLCSRLRS